MQQPNFLEIFCIEAAETLEDIERSTLLLETNVSKAQLHEIVNQIFRGFHNIKGSGGTFSFEQLVHFTHKVETLLDLVRKGSVAVNVELVDVILASADYVKELLVEQSTQMKEYPPTIKVLVEKIDRLCLVGAV